ESATLAPTRFCLSGSETAAEPDSVTAGPFSVKDALAVPESVGGLFTPVSVTAVVAVELRLLEPEPSLRTQVTWWLVTEPKSVGLRLVELKETESSTDW